MPAFSEKNAKHSLCTNPPPLPSYLSTPIRNVCAGKTVALPIMPLVYLVSPYDPRLYREMCSNLMICDQSLILHSGLPALRRL